MGRKKMAAKNAQKTKCDFVSSFANCKRERVTNSCSLPILTFDGFSNPTNDLVARLSWQLSFAESAKIEGIVIGTRKDGEQLVQNLGKDDGPEFFILNGESRDVGPKRADKSLGLQDVIIIEKTMRNGDQLYIKAYTLKSKANWGKPTDEIIAVAELSENRNDMIAVVGARFTEPTLYHWDCINNPVKPGDFLIGRMQDGLNFYVKALLNSRIVYVKDKNAEYWYEQAKKNKNPKQNDGKVKKPKFARTYLADFRVLTKDEEQMILTNCRSVKDLSLDQAKLYIRDVYVTISVLEDVFKKKEEKEHTLEVEGETFIDKLVAYGRVILKAQLTEKDRRRVMDSQSEQTWRVGKDVQVDFQSRALDNNGNVMDVTDLEMVIDRFEIGTDGCVICFRESKRSMREFQAIKNCRQKIKGIFKIGPFSNNNNTILDCLMSSAFNDFFNKKELFDSWRGLSQGIANILNQNKPFSVQGRPLDSSQLKALWMTISSQNFSCIEAPPGSGKTFLIAAIVEAKRKSKQSTNGTIYISATTNNAITNAADKVKECFGHIKVTRNYSQKAEINISDKSKKISLKHMALEAERHINLDQHPNLNKSLIAYRSCKTEMAQRKTFHEAMKLAKKQKRNITRLSANFHEAYVPYVVGSTCELVARHGDFMHKSSFKKGKRHLKQFAATHLILDEASQLPPHLALAVYIRFPFLEKITLIGDSKQLGPYTPLEEGSLAYKMLAAGELERIGQTVPREYLWTVYRSNPQIVSLLLKPIYGDLLRSGLRNEDRNLAKSKCLPVAKDGTPALFVNVKDAQCANGVNVKELEVVLKLIHYLKGKKISGEDVVVVCNHLAQREQLLLKLKGTGEIGPLNTSVAVHTVDSYQGKESKVILYLTTKTCSNLQFLQRTFQFVANKSRGTVGVSRAQEAIYLFGEWTNLMQTEFWRQFLPGIVASNAWIESDQLI